MTTYEEELLLKLYLKYGTGELPFDSEGRVSKALKIQLMGYMESTELWNHRVFKYAAKGVRLSELGIKHAQQLLMERLDENEPT